jgi:hypothetical protein
MPKSNQIHIDKALENISVAYRPEGFVASQLCPSVPVKHDTDKYYVYSKNQLSLPETLRAPGASANEVDFDISTGAYSLEKHSLKRLVTDDEIENSDVPIKPRIDATENLTWRILARREKSLAALVSSKANWANETSLTSTFAWNANTTLSNPITLMDSCGAVIVKNSGFKPNVMLIDYSTFLAAKEHVSVIDRIKFTSPDSVTEAMLAKLLNVSQLLVPYAVENTANESLTDTMAFMWTDCAWLAYVERNPGLKKPSALYTFEQVNQGNPYRVKAWREEEREGEFVEVTSKFQHKSVASDCAFYVGNTVQ